MWGWVDRRKIFISAIGGKGFGRERVSNGSGGRKEPNENQT